MSISSRSSSDGIVPQFFRKMSQGTKADISIHLKTAEGSSASSLNKTYTTHDRIEGTVEIISPQDLPFANIEIAFIGSSKTFVERLSSTATIPGRTEASHQFLKLSQPLAGQLPEDGILKARETYSFEFVFVVPAQTLPRICNHPVENDNVHQAHVQLPPSLEGRNTADGGELDDLAPDMAAIRYKVVAKIVDLENNTTVKDKRLRVIPAVDEKPPLSVESDNDYIMRAEKNLKKGVFKGKLGTLTMEAAQPQSIRLPLPNSGGDCPLSTMATVMLRFDPNDATSQPPRLGALNSKLKATTFFASVARRTFPTRKNIQFDLHQGYHSQSLNLSSRCVAGVEWAYHTHDESMSEREETSRRTSAVSTSAGKTHSIPTPSSKYKHQGFYTAQILVPITLPSDKTFVPTFHSCTISRVYTLALSLGVHSVGVAPSVELKVPVQVSAESRSGAEEVHRGSLTAEEQQLEAREADDFFNSPRTVRPIDPQLVGGSSLSGMPTSSRASDLPPDYDVLARHDRQVRAY